MSEEQKVGLMYGKLDEKAAEGEQEHERLHVLLQAITGAGKSTVAATFPKPLWVGLFDAVNNARPYLERGIKAPIRKDEQFQVYYQEVFSRKDPNKLICRIEYWGEGNPLAPTSYGRWIKRSANLVEYLAKGGYQTAVLDSATSFEAAARYYSENYLSPEVKDMRQHYAFSTKACEQFLMMRWPNIIGLNTIVTAHVDDQKDESEMGEGGMVMRKMVALPGRMPNKLPSQYGEIWRVYKDQNGYHLQTDHRPGNAYACKSLMRFKDGVYPHYDQLWKEREDVSG